MKAWKESSVEAREGSLSQHDEGGGAEISDGAGDATVKSRWERVWGGGGSL